MTDVTKTTLLEPNPEFETWVATLDPKHWARHDISACRLGWEAGRAALATELLALRKRVGELEGAGWQMLDLLKRVVTVLDAEVFDELAADTLLRDAVTFLYTAKEPNGWQDIATAPRDGTHVHVAFAGTSSPQTVAHWFGPPDLPGLRAGNWYLSVQQLEGPPVHPTHWRTLPALPTPKEPS